MYRLKTQTLKNPVKKLEIYIPYSSNSEQKVYKKTVKVIKSKSSTQKYQQKMYRNDIYRSKTPQNINVKEAKLFKVKWQSSKSKSPMNRSNSPAYKQARNRIQTQIVHSNLNSSRNMDGIIKKVQPYRAPARLGNRYFRKQLNFNQKLGEMNKNLKKAAGVKKSRRPRYELRMIKKLGKSQTGDIILAMSNFNNILVALKSFSRPQIKIDFLVEQMKIHLYCKHPNILPAYGYHVGRNEVYLVMEFGFHNLYEEIIRTGPFTEEKTAKYLIQIISGIEYLHRNGIMHRDLKPENIICFGGLLKITDFGWSTKTDRQRKTLCGTLDYISPEVAETNFYDNKIDCWSIGVLMYEMLLVQPPFAQEGKKYQFSSFRIPEYLTDQCKDLLTKLLQIDPKKRLSARESLQHPFLENHRKSEHLFERKRYKQLKMDFQMVFNFQ